MLLTILEGIIKRFFSFQAKKLSQNTLKMQSELRNSLLRAFSSHNYYYLRAALHTVKLQ